MSLVLLAVIFGLPGCLIVITVSSLSYLVYFVIYLFALPFGILCYQVMPIGNLMISVGVKQEQLLVVIKEIIVLLKVNLIHQKIAMKRWRMGKRT